MPMRLYVNTVSCSQWEWANCSIKVELFCFLVLQEVFYHYATDEPTIYHTRGEHANHYATDEPTIYHTRGEHANHYATDEPTFYRTRGEHANYYGTDEPTIYHTRDEHANHYAIDAILSKIDFFRGYNN